MILYRMQHVGCLCGWCVRSAVVVRLCAWCVPMFGFSRITDTPTGDVQRGNTHSRPVQAARPRLVEGGLAHAELKAHGACSGGEGVGIHARDGRAWSEEMAARWWRGSGHGGEIASDVGGVAVTVACLSGPVCRPFRW